MSSSCCSRSGKATDDCPMIAYVDSSVLLRMALGQPNALAEWRQIDRGVSSALISTESLRTLDRLRVRAALPDTEVAKRRATILNLIGSLELVEIDATVLDRAAQPMPTELGTLDAIHLASALLWKDATGIDPVMATHDGALGLAAQAHGLKVVGI
jgi:predicted nucleic acid-binding protein